MFHVRLKWLTWIQIFHAVMASTLAGLFVYQHFLTHKTTLIDKLGVNPLAFGLLLAVVVYSAVIYPFIRHRWIWWAHFIGFGLQIAALEVIIEKSGGYQSWATVPAIFETFLTATLGPVVPFVLVAFTLIFLALTYTGIFVNSNTNGGFLFVTSVFVSAVMGTLLFRNRYTSRKEEGSKVERLGSLLHDEQIKSEILLESISDGVVVINNEGAIQLFNPAIATMTGWHIDEALGLDYRSILSFTDTQGKNIAEDDNPFTQVLQSNEHLNDDNLMLSTKGGKKIFVSLAISPINQQQTGEKTGAIAIFRDVSKQHEEEQQRAEFISTASHEMRTPVAAIEGFLALALNPAVAQIDSKAKEYLDKAHNATQHLGQLFQDLLTISKAEDGRLENHAQIIELGAVFHELTDQWRFTVAKKGLKLKFMIGDQEVEPTENKVIVPLYYVEVDPERIREVFTNLFDNAVKYTSTGGITIRLQGDDQSVQVSIEDTGTGIASEDIPHLFQKFYRIDNSATRQVGGTGLGLYICRKIIDLYHGHITVESEVGKGSKFIINLPRVRQMDAEKAKSINGVPAQPLEPPTANSSPLPGPKPASAPVAPRPTVKA